MSFTANHEKRKIVMLTITERCNLNCSYCYEHNKTPRTMKFETAKKILDYEFSLDDGFNAIEVDLFGGEPFLEFELLKSIHDYAIRIQSDHRRICFSTSNATLIHGEIQNWLEKNKDSFCVGISLDGTRKMHNINRSNSFDNIDIEFFKKCWPNQDVKMTVSKESLPYLAEGIQYIQSLGYACSGSFAFGIDWVLEEDLPILEGQLQELAKFYIDNPNIPIAEIVDLSIECIGSNDLLEIPKWCGAGKEMKAYDVLGNYFPCQSFMGITLGREFSIDNISFENESMLSDPKCMKCVIKDICSTCYGMNYVRTGKLYERDKEHCEFNKLITQFNAYVKFHRIMNKKQSDYTIEDYQILNSVVTINEAF